MPDDASRTGLRGSVPTLAHDTQSTRNAEPWEAGRDSSLCSGGRGCSGDDEAVGTSSRTSVNVDGSPVGWV